MNKYIYPATLLCDFYKVSHREQYPLNTEKIYATWTPRMSRIKGVDKVVAFGYQAFCYKYLLEYFNDNFFSRPLADVVNEYKRALFYTLGKEVDASHIAALHTLGYIPLKICAVKEGTRVNIRTPMLTVENTVPEFFWVTNYIETLMSGSLWIPSTSATIAYQYRQLLDKYAEGTNGDLSGVQFQGHDFSMRGMSLESAITSGAGHLLSFTGTDTIPAILYLENYYHTNIENELIGTSISATEHSVMCAYGRNEYESYKRLLTEVYPTGFFSVVSDTWNLWDVLNNTIASLKDIILSRDGRCVIRPDSGDPVKILCGDPNSSDPSARKGVIEILWDIFGGTITERGYKQLDSHIGCIYGDAITLERCEQICQNLAEKGFASTNMVYGIGSFTYQYNTRDTFGYALKTTYGIFGGEERFLYKDPVTDDGTKKSQTGKVVVYQDGDDILYRDGLTAAEYDAATDNLLEVIFEDGKMLRTQTLKEVREKLAE